MLEKIHTPRGLLLLLSLVLVILMYPMLDHSDEGRLILSALLFVPAILATVEIAQTKAWMWPPVLLMSGALIFGVASTLFPGRALLAVKWIVLTLFFGLTVASLFTYLKNARVVSNSHLYTAVSIYIMLGMLFFSLYSAIDILHPGAFQHGTSEAVANRPSPSELLYFSLITLSTIGYGDIVPVYGEARMFAALEGMIGVLYVAITIAVLVSAYKQPDNSRL